MKYSGSFGIWLKQRRKALDLTQQELADQVGCSVVTIRKFEREVARPSKQIADRLADALAVSQDERTLFIGLARRVTDKPPELYVNLGAETVTGDRPAQLTSFIGRA